MSCFPCFSSQKSKDSDSREIPVAHATGPDDASPPPPGIYSPPYFFSVKYYNHETIFFLGKKKPKHCLV